jgi:hypothetical protein
MTRLRNVGVFIRENVWLEPNLFPYKYPNISQTSHSSHLPDYEDGTDSVPKRRYIKFRRRGITQKTYYISCRSIHFSFFFSGE